MPSYYDVHALLTVASDVPLPELKAFARPAADLDARIRVRVAGWRARRRRRAGDRLTYDEALGRFGFAIEVSPSGAIEIEVSPLLSRSPHSLYGKVVEPVLRWAFVREGWALVHGACFADGNDAYLISAPADTGKTMTMLTLLRRYPQLAFLADDLCLVSADGKVLDFPKPMTLSRHTLPAVNSHVLSVRERATLVVQSRVHSRSTRRVAERLDRVGLPMATASAVVERIVPRPLLELGRLLPHAKISHGARVSALFLIERGRVEAMRDLSHEAAMKILHDNCDDGFASGPSDVLAERLRHQGGCDWREKEHSIVDAAFAGQTTTLLESSRFEWWRPIASGIGQPSAKPRRVAIAAPRRPAMAAVSAR
jgi:hypothetical protein